jgi:hypothetical protein
MYLCRIQVAYEKGVHHKCMDKQLIIVQQFFNDFTIHVKSPSAISSISDSGTWTGLTPGCSSTK